MAALGQEIAASVKSDFDLLWAGYPKDRLEDPVGQKSVIRSLHKYATCFGMLAKAVGARPEHQRIFLQETASDAIHFLHTLMMGDARGGSFYLRSVIENFWRHQYFRSHPVEFGWLHTKSKYHLTMTALKDYCSWLDCFNGELRKSLQALDQQYAELSTRVHSTKATTLVLRETLAQIRLTKKQCSPPATQLNNVYRDVLVLTVFASRDVIDGMHVNAQAFIISCLDTKRKQRRQRDL